MERKKFIKGASFADIMKRTIAANELRDMMREMTQKEYEDQVLNKPEPLSIGMDVGSPGSLIIIGQESGKLYWPKVKDPNLFANEYLQIPNTTPDSEEEERMYARRVNSEKLLRRRRRNDEF